MLKQTIFFICILGYNIIYADNSVANINIPPSPTPQSNNYSSSTTKSLNLKYTVFDYQMTANEFSIFLKEYNLAHNIVSSTMKNIVFMSILNNQEFDPLTEKLTKKFTNKSSGASKCIVENNLLCGSFSSTTSIQKTTNSKANEVLTVNKSSISYRTYINNNKNISVKATSDSTINEDSASQSISFHSDAFLSNVLNNKNYIFISQFTNSGILIGQITLVSFNS